MTRLPAFILRLKNWAAGHPTGWDAFILSAGLLVITWHPLYLFGTINLFEAGLYLPGIDAILKGQIPYRDFLHLRGPLELYVPAWWMRIFGENFSVLPTYFYVGTIVTLMICLLIAKEIIQSRFFLYAMALTLIARTFPRVSFTIGGGIRLAWGVAAVYCVIQFLKRRKRVWLILAGIACASGLMTSVEIGIYAFLSVLVTLCADSFVHRREWFPWSSIVLYGMGAMMVIIPLCLFMQTHQALIPMMKDHYEICLNMMKTFPQENPVPHNILEVVMAMINPGHVNFKHMTPLYCYAGIFMYLIHLLRSGRYRPDVFCVFLYGLLLFIGSMRGLWGPAFEIALQPEKILLFYLVERVWSWLHNGPRRHQKIFAALLATGVFFSTTSFSWIRFQRRFQFVQIVSSSRESLKSVYPFSERDLVRLDLPRMKGMVVPLTQAQDMRELYRFMQLHTKPSDPVVFFPDLGVYHFIVDRPFVSRFPVVTLSWIGTGWHKEFMAALDRDKPSYIVMYKEFPEYYPKTQLFVPGNKRKHEEFLAYVQEYYKITSSTPTLNIWERTR